jgi:hypothetical protein
MKKADREAKRQKKIHEEEDKHTGKYKPNLKKIEPYNKDFNVTVHLVAHTHDDVGWVKTVEEYFSGMEMKTSNAAVRIILDTVIE